MVDDSVLEQTHFSLFTPNLEHERTSLISSLRRSEIMTSRLSMASSSSYTSNFKNKLRAVQDRYKRSISGLKTRADKRKQPNIQPSLSPQFRSFSHGALAQLSDEEEMRENEAWHPESNVTTATIEAPPPEDCSPEQSQPSTPRTGSCCNCDKRNVKRSLSVQNGIFMIFEAPQRVKLFFSMGDFLVIFSLQ